MNLRCINPLMRGWPEHQPQTEHPKPSRFADSSFSSELDDLSHQLRLLKANNASVYADLDVGRSGRFLVRWNRNDDNGVAVHWKVGDENFVLAIDRYATPAENLRAIVKTIEALRGIDRWGGDALVQQAFSAFQPQLPLLVEPERSCWEILGIDPGATRVEIMAAFLERVKTAHPDHGGNDAAFQELMEARRHALEEVGDG